jgi:hypothetical protein
MTIGASWVRVSVSQFLPSSAVEMIGARKR